MWDVIKMPPGHLNLADVCRSNIWKAYLICYTGIQTQFSRRKHGQRIESKIKPPAKKQKQSSSEFVYLQQKCC